MRSVRCDVCGNKALIAASKCPKCGHLFEVRDGFGDLLPLSFCATCESYYPETAGSCRWCGTKPEPPPISPQVWKRVGIGALVALVGVGWLLRDTEQKSTPKAPTAQRTQDSTVKPVVAVAAPVDTSSSRVQLAGAIGTDSVQAPAPETARVATVASNDSLGPIEVPALPPAGVSSLSSKPPATAAAKARSSVRWVNSVSRDWVVVRAGPSKTSRLVASIGPNSRVQLGESRGTWRRIKARGLSGWVEPRSLFASTPAARPRALVTR